MAARVQRQITLLVISLIVAVISLPMSAAAVTMPTWAKPLGSIGDGLLRVPIRAALNPDGSMYVSDPRNGGILKYSPSGALLKRITAKGIPQSMAVLPDGNLVVTIAEYAHCYASIIDSVSGLEIKRLKNSSGQEQHFGFADGVTVDDGVGAAGSIYVVDTKALSVFKFGLDGSYKSTFSVRGAPEGVLNLVGIPTSIPTSITYEKASGLLAVVDKTVIVPGGSSLVPNCIRFYDKNGTLVLAFGLNDKAGPLTFSSPQSIAFQYNANGTLKRMYVVDTFNSSIQVIDPVGTLTAASKPKMISFMGDFGFDAPKGELHLPVDAVFDPVTNRLAVVNGNGNVVYYGVDGGSNPAPLPVVPPVLSLTPPYGIVGSTSLTISGTVTAGSSVSCVLNDLPVASWKSNGTTTNWSCLLTGLVANNNIQVIAQNNSPVNDVKTANVKYVPDAPQIAVDNFPAYVNTPTIALGGATDASTLSVCNPKPGNCVTAVIASQRWDVAALPLASGANNSITIEASKSGVDVSQPIHGVLRDNTAPKLRVSVVANNATVTDQVQNVTGLVSDPEGLLAGIFVNSFNDVGAVISTQTASVENNGVFSIPMVGVTSYNVVARDLAGNETTFPLAGTNKIKYDPSKKRVKITSDYNDGAVVTQLANLLVAGTIEADSVTGYTLTVNGVNATIDELTKSWTARFNLIDQALNDGLNDIQIVASDGASSKLTLIHDSINPEATIITPSADTATRNSTYTLRASDGTAVLLTINHQGTIFPVPSNADFNVGFTSEGVYPILLKASDSNGLFSQVVRNIIYDTTPPVASFPSKYSSLQCTYDTGGKLISCSSACPGGICLQTSFSGVIEAGATVHLFDGAGAPVDTAGQQVIYADSGRSWSLSGLSIRDPYDTLIKVTDAAGNIKTTTQAHPDGNILVDTTFDTADVNFCMQKVSSFGPSVPQGVNLPLTALLHGDVAPLLNGNINPDGYIDIVDCIMLSRKLNGMVVPF